MAKVLVTLSDELIAKLDAKVGRGSRSAMIEEALWAFLPEDRQFAGMPVRVSATVPKDAVALVGAGRKPLATARFGPVDALTGAPLKPRGPLQKGEAKRR